MDRPPQSPLAEHHKSPPDASIGCLGWFAVWMVALYLATFGWASVVRKANKSRRFSERFRRQLIAARKRSGPVVCDVDLAFPRGVPPAEDLKVWLNRALGAIPPTRLAENAALCWAHKSVFELVYRYAHESVFRPIDALGCGTDSPFDTSTPGGRFVLNHGRCSGLTSRAITSQTPWKHAWEWTGDERSWSLVCEVMKVHCGENEPRTLWAAPDSKAWRGVREGGYFVLHDPRISLTLDPDFAATLLGTWGDRAEAERFAAEFTSRTGVGTCVAREAKE